MSDVCVLSSEECGRLENWATWPACKSHRHVKRKEAEELVESGIARWAGGEDTAVKTPVSMIVRNRITSVWQPVPTSGLLGFRTWGLSPQR